MRTPTPEQLPMISALLEAYGLPTDDLSEQDLSLFRIQESSGCLQAIGGLERCGDVALIRSVATTAAVRGRGMAGEIVDGLEALAMSEGFDSIFLITNTAQGYFEARGYSRIERTNVPQSVRDSRQFSTLCPGSATVMCKRIGRTT
jgi:amino-acid N-acetyltransferase